MTLLHLKRLLLLLLIAFTALQLFFVLRIAAMIWIAPESTSFERSNVYQIALKKSLVKFAWRQDWVSYERISKNLKRAVIASEDAAFTDHDGVDWDAIEKAWDKNAKIKPSKNNRPVKLVGGSTITQQLAKNLFLSGERTYLRKAQEYALVVALEVILSKERIYEIYLNHVEWGEGVFGAQAAAQHYFRKNANALDSYEAAMLAVMLPRPKYFERRIHTSEYLQNQASTVQARMGAVDIP
jgi:monofunctional glycosyltransferase